MKELTRNDFVEWGRKGGKATLNKKGKKHFESIRKLGLASKRAKKKLYTRSFDLSIDN